MSTDKRIKRTDGTRVVQSVVSEVTHRILRVASAADGEPLRSLVRRIIEDWGKRYNVGASQ